MSRFDSTRVSIHAPARGATFENRIRLRSSRRFNPRAREGRDDKRGLRQFFPREVSIHAPARGATCVRLHLTLHVRRFNPRAREGRDSLDIQNIIVERSFNPRAREGRDYSRDIESLGKRVVSIHAPARGATKFSRSLTLRLYKFQSTRPRGARRTSTADSLSIRRFQSTRPRGARLTFFVTTSPTSPVSIHAPARGATETSA